MKRMIGVVVWSAVFVYAGMGQEPADPNLAPAAPLEAYQQVDVGRYDAGYARCLLCANDGVVESAIREVLLIKLAQPNVNSDRIERALENLCVNGSTPMIRLKASLAKFVYDNPAAFVEQGRKSYGWESDVFGEIAGRMRETLFVRSE